MLRASKLIRFGLVACLLATPVALSACGGSQKSTSTIPKAGDMPEGGEWTGVYFSPTYGNLHIVKEGADISGKWRTAEGDKWGEMHGEVNGNLFHFEWKETTIGMVGPSATTTGRGYFQYYRPPGDNVNDELHGEWGLGTEETGVPWTAVKQRNVKPDPDSVVPDETQKLESGGWDEDKKKKSDKSSDSNDGWN